MENLKIDSIIEPEWLKRYETQVANIRAAYDAFIAEAGKLRQLNDEIAKTYPTADSMSGVPQQ